MDLIFIFAWFVIALIFCVFVAVVIVLGSLPGNIARKRNHPHVDAINAASWIGLALGGAIWPIAFIWAFIPFGQDSSMNSDENPVVGK
ncbi:hypothetical protein C5Y96_14870 [Blastopirellula marina]|uniref:DUF3302 domain-containing protein n=1 Tax=Blastopirellula marina TaxID=124 RepID=A0A2S8FEZ9_9BACT|nr:MULTISPECIES: DUF3302 domain-containing protein [Pirellulaceae]PQO30739.1 hypothetical protein C5Y96_14870 [Blastopirellula marina]RCS50876.1 DUF3302 domain-containing protein [Bremerella cremea]